MNVCCFVVAVIGAIIISIHIFFEERSWLVTKEL
jgi:hypothetical protein